MTLTVGDSFSDIAVLDFVNSEKELKSRVLHIDPQTNIVLGVADAPVGLKLLQLLQYLQVRSFSLSASHCVAHNRKMDPSCIQRSTATAVQEFMRPEHRTKAWWRSESYS